MSGFSDQNLFLAAVQKIEDEDDFRRSESLRLAASKSESEKKPTT